MQLQLIDFRQHRGGLVLQSSTLSRVIFRRILARTVFEIQIAKILVQHIFLFAQEVEACFRNLPRGMPLGIKDERKDGEQKKATGNGAHIWVSRRMRSRVAAKPGVLGSGGVGTVRIFQLRTSSKVHPIPRKSTSGGMTHARWLNRVNMGEARITGPYCSWNWWKMASALSPLAMLADNWESITGETGQPT